MNNVKSEVVLPGDVIIAQLPSNVKIRLGPGLSVEGGAIHATNVGVLKQTQNRKLWIRTRHKKYTKSLEYVKWPFSLDTPLPVAIPFSESSKIEIQNVDINAPWVAELPVTAFENVTRRNIPQLKPGDVIFSTVLHALPHSNPVLSCTNTQGKANGMGVLKGGQMTKISCSLARSLLSHPMHLALELLGNQFHFEIVVGMNGMMWIDAQTPLNTILISRTLSQCEDLDLEGIRTLCQNPVLR